jgi:hypothetical protein
MSPLRLAPALLALAAGAAEPEARPERVHQVDRLRIFYALEGRHAVDPTDANGNGTPDQVEDIATQTLAARDLWIGVLGYPDPFASERYREAAYLDVHLRHRETLGANGSAYDELQSYRKPGDPAGTRSLGFSVATSVKAAENLTPAHEYFHLIQNGATYFKNRWFTEGTARWSEAGLGAGVMSRGLKAASWPPARPLKLDELAYETAGQFWEPLLLQVDAKRRLPELPTSLKERRYVNGQPVLHDPDLAGWAFVRDLLAELGRADDRAFQARALTRWSEDEQKSPANTPFLEDAVRAVARRHGLATPAPADR